MMPGHNVPIIAHEELEDTPEGEELKTHPLLPGSALHYFVTPRERHFEGYTSKLAEMEALGKAGFDKTATRDCPLFIDTPELLNIQLTQERMWAAQWTFTRLCIENPTVDRIGYWYSEAPKSRTLDTLCSRTEKAYMLSTKPHLRLDYNHHYNELGNEQSRLMRKIKEMGVSAFFLLDFDERTLVIIRSRYPQAWIVGIKTPDDGMQARIAQIVATREQMRKDSFLPKEPKNSRDKKKNKGKKKKKPKDESPIPMDESDGE